MLVSGWFRYDDNILNSWVIDEFVGDPYRVKIYRKGSSFGDASQRVFVYYPRPSSAYDTSIVEILNVFEEKKVDADFTVFNFRKMDKRGQAGLKDATIWGTDLIFSMGSESTAWLWKNYRGEIILGDIITALDGKAVANNDDYLSFMEKKKPGDEIVISTDLNGQTREYRLRLAEPQ